MSSRFTERSQQIILIAEEQAKQLNHDYVGTEHLLLALLALGEGVANQVLLNLGADADKIRHEVIHIVGSGDNAMLLGNIPFTPRAKKVLEFAVEEAQALGQSYVGTEHLLLGLIREEEGVAAQVLDNFGFKLDLVREEITNLVNGEDPTEKPLKFKPQATATLEPKTTFEVASIILDRLYEVAHSVKNKREFKVRAEELLHIYFETRGE